MSRREILLFVAAIFTAYFFIGLQGFLLVVTGFLPDYSDWKTPLLAPSDAFLSVQLLFHFSLTGISLYTVWRKGFKHHQVQKATALHFLQMALAGAWPFANSALDSYILSMLVMCLFFLVLAWTIVVVRRISEFGAYALVPILVVDAAYLYFITHFNILNPDI